MKIKDIIKGKITNITEKEWGEEYKRFIEKEYKDTCYDDIIIGDNYVFNVYDFYDKFEFNNMVCLYGHDTIILYDKNTKTFKEQSTR